MRLYIAGPMSGLPEAVLHGATCDDRGDSCAWSGEDPDLTDCHDETGAWRPTGLEAPLAAHVEALREADRAALLTLHAALFLGGSTDRQRLIDARAALIACWPLAGTDPGDGGGTDEGRRS